MDDGGKWIVIESRRLLLPYFSYCVDSVQPICMDIQTITKMAPVYHWDYICLMGYSGNMVWFGVLSLDWLALWDFATAGWVWPSQFLHQFFAPKGFWNSSSRECSRYIDVGICPTGFGIICLFEFFQKEKRLNLSFITVLSTFFSRKYHVLNGFLPNNF